MNDGGPAFPHLDSQAWPAPQFPKGMSLRDWFAGQAMTGLLSERAHPEVNLAAETHTTILAKSSYEIADAMLAAREGKAK